MYSFRDVNEASDISILPSEALQLNGEYIENLIEGYRTLSVSGREALSPELETYETGVRDGSTLKSKRYPARTIVVQYMLQAESPEAFRAAYNQLAGILDVEEAELIFNDEKDKYYTGTPSAIGEVEPGRNSVVGEFEILCVDPFKYSVAEYEVEATKDADGNTAFNVDYKGTYKTYPKLVTEFYNENEASADGANVVALTGAGDCGFVAFFNEDAKIIQLGDPEEVDGTDDRPKSQTLISQSFTLANGWDSAAKRLWSVNNGVTSSYAVEQVGAPGIAKVNTLQHYLTAKDWGSGDNWHGPSITREIPADESGIYGAVNFALSYSQHMCIGGTGDVFQLGAFQVMLTDAEGKIVCGVSVYKGLAGKMAKLRFYMANGVAKTVDIDLSHNNKYFGTVRKADKSKGITAINPVNTSSITKAGSKVSFNIGGLKYVFVDSKIGTSAVTKVTFTFSKFGLKQPLYFNGLYWAKFIKNNCDTWRDIPNKFSANDVLVADCESGEIFLNDLPKPEYGALGNEWEEFYLKPGYNTIGCSYSEWLTGDYVPTCKMIYREVFL